MRKGVAVAEFEATEPQLILGQTDVEACLFKHITVFHHGATQPISRP